MEGLVQMLLCSLQWPRPSSLSCSSLEQGERCRCDELAMHSTPFPCFLPLRLP